MSRYSRVEYVKMRLYLLPIVGLYVFEHGLFVFWCRFLNDVSVYRIGHAIGKRDKKRSMPLYGSDGKN